MTEPFVVGVDLGGTKVEACLLDANRHILDRVRLPSEADKGADRVVENIHRVIDRVSAGRDYAAVGMGTPATYLENEDRLFGAPHTPLYETAGFINRFRSSLSVPLLIENDANCLVLAEFFAGCSGTYRSVMAVILGTGMGSGLVLEDRLYRGAAGGAGEIGHTSVDMAGRLCECGRRGCAEAYLSGPSHSRRYFERTGRRLELQDIYSLYEQGENQAVELMEESCRVMASVFADAVNILDLEAIILGGGVSNLPVWYSRISPLMKDSFFGVPRPEFPLIKAKLGDSAGVVGAAYLALRHIGRMEF
ncbi:MAG: ROK family protein [Candidatus Aminicenantes bacterium]|nr:ROK family protein [Candidatus Aminicenantes bacterium]